MQISTLVFFSVWDEKHPFWANLVKIVSLSWNLVPRPILISRIQWQPQLNVYFVLLPNSLAIFKKIDYLHLNWFKNLNLKPILSHSSQTPWKHQRTFKFIYSATVKICLRKITEIFNICENKSMQNIAKLALPKINQRKNLSRQNQSP